MKTQLYKILFALILIPALSCANNDFKGRYTKQKKINKTYQVGATDKLQLDNSYGNLDIVTWDENRVEIEVVIITNGNDEEKVQERLDEINVRFNQSDGAVSAQTVYRESNTSWWESLFGGMSNVNMEINYKVKAPAKNQMELSNDYGNINLNRLEGNLRLSCDYGRFRIGELRGERNYLQFDYTRNSSIDYVRRAKIEADYSEFRIEEAGTIELSADYTDAFLTKVERISFNNDYGSLQIDKLKAIKGQGDYLGVKLGMLYGTADINTDYGSLSIGKMMPSVGAVNINSDYTSVKIGYDKETSFTYEVDTSYGDVKGLQGNDFNINKHRESGADHYYQGHHLSNSGGQVRVKSSYGSVRFQSEN